MKSTLAGRGTRGVFALGVLGAGRCISRGKCALCAAVRCAGVAAPHVLRVMSHAVLCAWVQRL